MIDSNSKIQTYSQPYVYSLSLSLPRRIVGLIHKKTAISRPTIYKFLRGLEIRTHEKQRILATIIAFEKENTSLVHIETTTVLK